MTMKPALFLSAPPLAFIAAALLAGLMAPDHAPHDSNKPIPISPRKRAAVMASQEGAPNDTPAVLAKLERQIVHFPPPEVETYDGAGLERSIQARKKYEGFPINWGSSYEWEWADKAPQEMFEWLIHQGVFSGKKRNELTSTLFSRWAESDMPASLTAIQRIPFPEDKSTALKAVLDVMHKSDPARACGIFKQNIDLFPKDRDFLHYQYSLPPDITCDEILKLPPSSERTKLLAQSLSTVSYGQSGVSMPNAESIWPRLSESERRDLVAAGFTTGSNNVVLPGLMELVRESAESANDPDKARIFLYQYGESWAKSDPDAALSWAMKHLKGKERTEQTLKLITHAASTNFDAALQAWRNLPDGSLRYKAADKLSELAPADREEDKAMLLDSLPKPGAW